jgi:glycogen debranching enzyme
MLTTRLSPDFNRTIEIDIPITSAGAFAFYTTYVPLPDFSTGPSIGPKPMKTPLHYIDVSPKLTLGKSCLPLDALSIFSVISKCMGKYPTDWDRHLRGIGQRGYNMVHFTPLMQRGDSNSPYSLYNQLEFDPECFPNGEKDIAEMIDNMENEYDLLGLTDVVWNHTANNSKWLEEHPEAGYNVETAPWLTAALELDEAMLKFGEDLEKNGLPTEFKTVDDLTKVMNAMKSQVIVGLKLWEYYALDVERDEKEIETAWKAGTIEMPAGGFGSGVGGLDDMKGWPLKQKADFIIEKGLVRGARIEGRGGRQVNPKIAAALLTAISGRYDTVSNTKDTIVGLLNEINIPFYREYDADVAEILEQVFNRIKYVRIDDHGPKLGPVTKKDPFIESYFTRLPLNESTKKHNPKSLALVNNGWIWNADAMKDNAGPDSKAYIRREVIVWSDCVKLRYGKGPEDNPYLWDHMSRYTRLMAKYFAGFRIDNCHSTPLVVAEYLLDEARKVRPNLAVFAELFTGSEQTDYEFVKRLGLSALIREAMQAWGTGELSRLVHRHGGRPIGSFEIDLPTGGGKKLPDGADGTVRGREVIRHIRQTPVHALFMDCTHDNEVPAQKRDARDTLPNAALVNMCACATGSVMGYDEIYPKLVDIVQETRQYDSPYSDRTVKMGAGEGGIGGVKKLLNQIHTMMGKDGYDETHIHHEGETVTVHRVHPESRQGYFLIAHTAFPGYGNGNSGLKPVHLIGTKAKPLGSWMLEVDASNEAKEETLADKEFLRGLPSRVKDLKGVTIETKGNDTVISIPDKFPPGSIALFETWIPGAAHSEGLGKFINSGTEEAFSELDLVDLNFLLYRCDAEERDSSDGNDGVYNVPNHGSLVYAGLQGWWSVLQNIVKYNDLGHPLCNHLRDGQWSLDYVVGRLERISKQEGYEHLLQPAMWLKNRFDAVRTVPSFLLPRYFALIIQIAYNAAFSRGVELMSPNVRHGQNFLQRLAMVSVQQTGYTKSASLWPTESVPCMAAGLPHFSTDWARCWGRDVFISLRGLLLCTGRFGDAKEHIVAFGSVVKHGMIPNLHSSGKLPRYNSRDSPWFYLQAIQDYTKIAPEGLELLKAEVPRRFLPYNDTWFEFNDPRAYSKTSTVEEIIQEILQRHASGLSFREANAGPGLDMQMSSKGFDINVKVDWTTGIIFGGSQHNCGTWMDKMGESEKAGSKGIPGTPRDGAAIEITGLAYSALSWVAELAKQGKFAHDGVTVNDKPVKFADWAAKIKDSFEHCYYVPLSSSDDAKYDVNPSIVARRGIYKDLYKSSKEYEDYQFRPNFAIAMTVAPALFDPAHALACLSLADTVLRGPTGMATLDPKDLHYRPYYNNSEDSTNFETSKGRNYHQGPEWLWPTGYFLRALLRFDLERRGGSEEGRVEAFQQITRRLAGCKAAIQESAWRGLTELTQRGGEFCGDSVSEIIFMRGCVR